MEKRIEENGDAKRYLHDNRRVICTCNSMSWVCTNWNEIMWPLSQRIQWQLGNYIILLSGKGVYVIEKMQQKSCHASNFSSQCAIVCVCDVKVHNCVQNTSDFKRGKKHISISLFVLFQITLNLKFNLSASAWNKLSPLVQTQAHSTASTHRTIEWNGIPWQCEMFAIVEYLRRVKYLICQWKKRKHKNERFQVCLTGGDKWLSNAQIHKKVSTKYERFIEIFFSLFCEKYSSIFSSFHLYTPLLLSSFNVLLVLTEHFLHWDFRHRFYLFVVISVWPFLFSNVVLLKKI